MKHFFALIAVVASVLVGAVVLAPVAAGQQETPAGNVTVTENTTVRDTIENASRTATPLTDGSQGKPNLELSGAVTLTKWRYDGSVWHITLRTRTVASVTVTDAAQIASALQEGEGAATGTADFRRYELEPAETQTITFAGSRFEGASAVSVAPNGDEGQIAILRTESFGNADTFVKQSTAGLLVLVAVSGTAIVTLRRVRNRLEDEDKGAERVL